MQNTASWETAIRLPGGWHMGNRFGRLKERK